MAMQIATATFTGAEDNVAVTWPAMAGNFGIAIGATVTDGSGPLAFAITARSSTGCTINPSAKFSGTVEVIVYDKP